MEEVIVNGKKYQTERVYSDCDGEVVYLCSINTGADESFECQHFKLLDNEIKQLALSDVLFSTHSDLCEIRHITLAGFKAGTITPVIEPKEGEWWFCEVTIEKNIATTETFGRMLQKCGTSWYPVHPLQQHAEIKPIHKMIKAED